MTGRQWRTLPLQTLLKNMFEAEGFVRISDTAGSQRRYAYLQIMPVKLDKMGDCTV